VNKLYIMLCEFSSQFLLQKEPVMSQSKKSAFEPVKQMYATWYEQYEQGLNEVETAQKKSLESLYGMVEKVPAWEMMKLSDSMQSAKAMQMNAVGEAYGVARKAAQEMQKQSMAWMNNMESMLPAMPN
jgi:hypothetical protein